MSGEVIDCTDLKVIQGAVLRLNMLMTHYRQPINFTQDRLREAEKIIKGWLNVCELNTSLPPVEVLECLCDDLNTPKMISILHRYKKQKMGKELFSSMYFLGFFGHSCTPSEIKTIPLAAQVSPAVNS